MGWRILLGILQALGLHFLGQQFGEREAGLEVRIAAGDEDGIAAEAVAEMALLALEFPVLEEFVGHGIMVDRQEQIGGQIVGRGDPPDEARPRLAFGHQQLRLGKAVGLQFLLDPLRQAQIEDELGDVAGADRAFRFGGMADIDNDPEFRGIARCREPVSRRQVQAGRRQRGKLDPCGALATRRASPRRPALARRRALAVSRL